MISASSQPRDEKDLLVEYMAKVNSDQFGQAEAQISTGPPQDSLAFWFCGRSVCVSVRLSLEPDCRVIHVFHLYMLYMCPSVRLSGTCLMFGPYAILFAQEVCSNTLGVCHASARPRFYSSTWAVCCLLFAGKALGGAGGCWFAQFCALAAACGSRSSARTLAPPFGAPFSGS